VKINYWDCKYNDYEEYCDSENEIETPIYGCTHPMGLGGCLLDNKYGGNKADCRLLDEKKEA
jgi:hypothetical protein